MLVVKIFDAPNGMASNLRGMGFSVKETGKGGKNLIISGIPLAEGFYRLPNFDGQKLYIEAWEMIEGDIITVIAGLNGQKLQPWKVDGARAYFTIPVGVVEIQVSGGNFIQIREKTIQNLGAGGLVYSLLIWSGYPQQFGKSGPQEYSAGVQAALSKRSISDQPVFIEKR